jgi:hypothetical protein
MNMTRPLLQAGQRLPDIAVDDIIVAAGISRSTFYQRFSDKPQLRSAWPHRRWPTPAPRPTDTLGHLLWLALRHPDDTAADASKG